MIHIFLLFPDLAFEFLHWPLVLILANLLGQTLVLATLRLRLSMHAPREQRDRDHENEIETLQARQA